VHPYSDKDNEHNVHKYKRKMFNILISVHHQEK
jgi:hypothetical protein